MIYKTQKSLKICEVTDLFSFQRNSAVHMITRKGNVHIEYKSYNDGKIRVCDIDKIVYPRPDFDRQYELKWFKR